MFWVPEPTLAHVANFFVLYSGFALAACAFGLLAAFGLYDLVRSKRGPTAWLLLAWLLVPIVVPFVVSHLYRPMLLDRYTIAASPAFYLLIAGGIEALRGIKYSRALAAAFAIAVAVVSSVATFGYFAATSNTPWREIAGYVEGHARPGDLVLFNEGSGRLMFGYYLKREGVSEEVLSVENPSPPLTWKEMREGLRPAVMGRRRIWLVQSNWGSTPHSRKVLKKVLMTSRGSVLYSESYPVDDAYNRKLATFPYQANVKLFLFAKGGDDAPGESRNTKRR
jgi:hypothetical protein